MAIDLNKYSVAGTSKPNDLSQYSVASSAPRLSDISQLSQQVNQSENKGLISQLGDRASQAYKSVTGKQQYPGQAVLGTTGAVGGAVNDVIGAVLNPFITKTVDALSNNPVTQAIATSGAGSGTLDAINTGMSKVGDVASTISEASPGLAQFSKDAFNTATLVPVGAITKEGINIGKDVSSLASRALNPSESAVQQKVISMFNKAVKPTAAKSANLADKYNNNIVSALQEIKANSPKLNLEDVSGEIVSRAPQSLNELNQALEQTKDIIFSQYDEIAKKAGSAGAQLNLEPIAQQLDTVAGNKALNLTAPEVSKYAQGWAERLRDLDTIDPQTAQEAIKMMNKNLDSFYKNPTYESASKVAVDAGIANNLRKELDSLIENSTGEQYQSLKNTYGSLKAIEKDVVRASIRDGRKNVKGLLDYTDMFTGGQMVGGILTLNPAMFTKGAIERGFKEYIKHLNDPNRIIKGMFDSLDKYQSSFVPASKTVGLATDYAKKNLSDGVPVGMSTKDITKNIHPEDVQTMQAFIDHVRIKTPLTTSQYNMAEKLSQRFGISMDKGLGGVAKEFSKILDGKKLKPGQGTSLIGSLPK